MTALTFAVVDARPEQFAAVPTISLRLRLTETSGAAVHAIALRTQIRIEPQRRRYHAAEEERLYELFGETPRWGDSLRPFPWTQVATVIPGFAGETEVDLLIACTYDFEVAGAKYLHALDDGEIPLLLLFSGTTFAKNGVGFDVEPIAWHEETTFRLPVRVWRAAMDLYFPDSGWVRVRRETLDALTRFKGARALPTWDLAFEQLLKEAGEEMR
jgi:hypothetical protein